MQLLLNVLARDVWLPKGKEENKTEVGGKGDCPLILWKSLQPEGRGLKNGGDATTMDAASLSAPLRLETIIN